MSFPSYSVLSCIRSFTEKFIAFHSTNSSRKLLTITYGDTTKSTEQELLTNRRINCCISEEPDARLVWHAICCVKTGCDPVVVTSVDTDVLVLMISHSPFMNKINSSTRVFATMRSNSKQIKSLSCNWTCIYYWTHLLRSISLLLCIHWLPHGTKNVQLQQNSFLRWIFETAEYSSIVGGICWALESAYGSHFWARWYFGDIFWWKFLSAER